MRLPETRNGRTMLEKLPKNAVVGISRGKKIAFARRARMPASAGTLG
jgi:hypothetical protein